MGLISDRGTGYDDGGYGRGRDLGYGFTGEESYGSGRNGGYNRRRPGGHTRGPVGRRRGHRRRGGRPVPVVAVVAIVASVVVLAAAAGVSRLLTARTAASNAPAVNMNCTLIVPANPLTAQGLATPYQLTATDPAAGPCNEANQNQTAFVQGAIIDPATGQVSIYDPLVIDVGSQPAVPPTVPTLPAGAVVALWFGYNGNTLSLAGPDQAPPSQASASATPTATALSPTATSSASASPTATSATGAPSAASSASASPSADSPATGAPSATSSATGAPSASSPDGTGSPSASPAGSTQAAAAAATAPKAATEAEGSAPLSPDSSDYARFNAILIKLSGVPQHAPGSVPTASPPVVAPSSATPPSASPSAPASAQQSAQASTSASAAPTAAASASTGASPTMSVPPVAAGDAPAASANPDATLQQANCVAGEVIGGQFSSFTQVGACNAAAFFSAANSAIVSRKLRVPPPGQAADGMRCLTTRSFALIDQDQSDNVTTEYLTDANGQTAQDTAANRQSMNSPAVLFNGSDNGLLDFFVDPALGCSPWQVPNLADGGALAPALPLDELQAARYPGGRGNPSALVPPNDPMTLDGNGQFSTDKTNTYRSLVDMPPLPAGQSPQAYCSDMERIQGSRLQQDVNLLTRNPGPAPAAADNLFTFLAMRLQQSFANLNCGSFGLQNDVSTTIDGNGVVVAACFLRQVAPVTMGAGNPMAGTATCPATTAPSSPGATAASPGGAPSTAAAGAAPSATASASASAWRRHHPRRHHWWW
jgi:hypothetical protein